MQVKMEDGRVLSRVENGVAIVTLNRPAARNAIDDDMRREFVELLDTISRDDTVRAVVLTGSGKSFCSGGDVAAMQQRLNAPSGQVAGNGWRRQQRTHHAVAALRNLDKPTIAAVNGFAVGLGCDLALCCDFIVASEAAVFAMSYIQRGLIPDGGGLYLLPRRVGLPRAKELIFSGRRVDAKEAVAIGMADRLSTPDNLVAESVKWAAEMSQCSRTALGLAKSILNKTFELSAEDVFALGSQAQAICYTSAEHRESVEAFLTKK